MAAPPPPTAPASRSRRPRSRSTGAASTMSGTLSTWNGSPAPTGPSSSAVSLGLLRVDYRAEGRAVVLLSRRLPLLSLPASRATRSKPARGGSAGRSTAESSSPAKAAGRATCGSSCAASAIRPATGPGPARIEVRAEVSNFYPLLRRKGPLRALRGADLQRDPAARRTCGSRGDSCARSGAWSCPPRGSGALERSLTAAATAAVHRLRQRRRFDLEELHAGRVLDDGLGRQALDQRSGDAGVDRGHQPDPVRAQRRGENRDADPRPRRSPDRLGGEIEQPAVGGHLGAADLESRGRPKPRASRRRRPGRRRTSATAIGCVLFVVQLGVTIAGRRRTR